MEERIEPHSEEVPSEVKKWNWGAFFLSWIWGIGNHVWISFLSFVPFVGFIDDFCPGSQRKRMGLESEGLGECGAL